MIATDGDTSALWERPGGHLLRRIYGPWRAVFDGLVLATVVGFPKGATLNELWIDVPGSRARLRASLARLLYREAIAWKMSSGITRYFPVSEEDAL